MAKKLSYFLLVCAVLIVILPMGHARLLSHILNGLKKPKPPIVGDPWGFESQMHWKIYSGCGVSCGFENILDVPVKDSQALYDNIDRKKPLVLYLHGYREQPSNESVRTVVAAYLQRATDNIVVLDWSGLASRNYIVLAATMLHDIAKILAGTIDRIVELGVDLETIHLVSHSLGTQLAGLVGKYSKKSIPRITGLDPANPGFYHNGAEHINEKSARFVDIIHTDGGVYGASPPTGTVDIFANGGIRPQPGCYHDGLPFSDDDKCSHQISWRYYAKSVLEEHSITAYQCDSHDKFLLGECADNRHIYVGYATPSDAKGCFYFAINKK